MTILQLHQEAMAYAQDAFIAHINNDEDTAIQLYHKAYLLEYDAAASFEPIASNEPTRSILYLSAASLAYHCNKLTEAIQIATSGITQNTPAEIAKEIESLIHTITHPHTP